MRMSHRIPWWAACRPEPLRRCQPRTSNEGSVHASNKADGVSMIQSYYPNTEQLQAGKRLRANLLIGWLVIITMLVVGAMTAVTYFYPNMEPLGIYVIGLTAFGFAHGVTKGGVNTTVALYEVRAQAYFFLAYLMTVNLIKDTRQVTGLLWTAVICLGFQGLCGALTYFSLNGNITEDGFM